MERSVGVRRLFASASINIAATIAAAVAGLLATSIMARQMSYEDIGRVLLLLSGTNAFAIFEGLRPVVIYRIANSEDDCGALFRAVSRVNRAAAVSALSISLLILLVAGSSLPSSLFAILPITVAAFFASMQYAMFLDAEADVVFTGSSRGMAWVLLYIAFALLSIHGAGLQYFALAICLTYGTLAFVYWRRFDQLGLENKYCKPSARTNMRADVFKQALHNISFNLSATTVSIADRALVGALMGAGLAGLYSGPSELALRAGGVLRGAMQAVLPWAVRQSNDVRYRQNLWMGAITTVLVTSAMACSLLIVYRDETAIVLLGEKFADAGDLLGAFGISVVASAVGYCSMAYLNAKGDFRTQRLLYSCAALFLVVGVAVASGQNDLVLIAWIFLAARSVDFVIAGWILLGCVRRSALTVAALFLFCAMSWAAAWVHDIPGLAGSLVIAVLLSLYMMRRIRVAPGR